MKEAQAIATLHRIGEDIIALADYLTAYYTNGKAELAEEAPAKAEPVIKLEDVRAVLAEISRSGKTAEMKALLGKFGASKLSDVNPKDYAALLEAAKEARDA
jgi:hypothetical protein